MLSFKLLVSRKIIDEALNAMFSLLFPVLTSRPRRVRKKDYQRTGFSLFCYLAAHCRTTRG
jgi:hypothetical protein